jgi:endoglucanase
MVFLFFRSYGYEDELVWAAIWLYQATNDQTYLDYAIEGYEQYELVYDTEVLSWDSKTAGNSFYHLILL